jgi:hypothetical protein
VGFWRADQPTFFQPMAAVLLADTIHQDVVVFIDAPLQVVGHADVEHAQLAGDNVDAGAVSFYCGSVKQIPPLRIAIDEANRNAPVGMTEFGRRLKSLAGRFLQIQVTSPEN